MTMTMTETARCVFCGHTAATTPASPYRDQPAEELLRAMLLDLISTHTDRLICANLRACDARAAAAAHEDAGE